MVAVIGDQRDVEQNGGCRDPGVGGLDRAFVAAGLVADPRPCASQFAIDHDDHEPVETCRHSHLAGGSPIALGCPPIEFGDRHERHNHLIAGQEGVDWRGSRVAPERRGDDVRIDDIPAGDRLPVPAPLPHGGDEIVNRPVLRPEIGAPILDRSQRFHTLIGGEFTQTPAPPPTESGPGHNGR